MRVLMVAPLEPDASGIGLYSHTLVEALKGQGTDVVGAPLRATDGRGLDTARPGEFVRALRARAEGDKTDVVHLQFEPGLLSLGQCRALARDPPRNLVVTLHRVPAYDGLWNFKGVKQRKAVWMERALVKAAKLLLTHSDHTLGVLAKRYPRAQCAVQPMPVPGDDCRQPREAGAPILFFGHVHPGKGALELSRAMKLMPDLRCIIAGPEDPKWDKLNRQLKSEMESAPNVTRERGWLPMERKHALLAGCSAVALPYTVGGFGSAVLQDAIAHERPVVASTVEPLASTVSALGVGAVSPLDPTSFAQALRKAAEETPTPYAQALAAARRDHAPDAVARLLVEKYDSLLA